MHLIALSHKPKADFEDLSQDEAVNPKTTENRKRSNDSQNRYSCGKSI